MIVLLVGTIILKVFVDTEPRIYFSLEVQVVPLALTKFGSTIVFRRCLTDGSCTWYCKCI